ADAASLRFAPGCIGEERAGLGVKFGGGRGVGGHFDAVSVNGLQLVAGLPDVRLTCSLEHVECPGHLDGAWPTEHAAFADRTARRRVAELAPPHFEEGGPHVIAWHVRGLAAVDSRKIVADAGVPQRAAALRELHGAG